MADKAIAAAEPPAETLAPAGYDEEEEEGEMCRICHLPGDAEQPLRHPCACRGSIKFVHEGCLLRWLSTSRHNRCEVCKHVISVCPVYAANAPARLPISEFILGLSKKVMGWLFLLLSLMFALSIWEFVMPLTTVWTWRLALARSFGEVRQLLSLRLSTHSILADGLYGSRFMPSPDVIFLCVSIRRTFLRELGHFRELNGLIRRAANVVAPFALWVAHLEAQLQQRFGRLDNLQVLVLHTVEAAVMVVAGDVVFACLFGFIPFSVGRVILYCISCFNFGNVDKSHISRASALFVGYGSIFSLVLLYTGVISFHQYMRGEHLTIAVLFKIFTIGISCLLRPFRRLPSLYAMAHGALSFLWQSFRGFMRLMAVINVSLNLLILRGICPWFFGWLLDVCASKLFGATVSQKLELLFISSFSSIALHWLIGCIYQWQHCDFASLFREALITEISIPFVCIMEGRKLTQFVNEPFHKFAYRSLFTLFLGAFHIAMVILVPVQIVTQVMPMFFPLDIIIFYPSTQSSTFLQTVRKYADLLSGILILKFLVCKTLKYLKPRALGKKLLQHWFFATGRSLGLTGLFLARPEETSELEMNTEAAKHWHSDAAEVQEKRKFLAVRILLLILLAWLAVVLFNSAMIIVPISAGRTLLGTIPRLPVACGLKSNDILAFAAGFCTISSMIAVSRYMFDNITTGRTWLLGSDICKWSTTALKTFPLLSIWIVIIPLLIGLQLVLLVIAPIMVPVDENPGFDLYCNWSLGLILRKLWTMLVHWTRAVPFLANFVDESWHMKLTRAREEGFLGLRAMWVLQEILIPITKKLLTALCVPYVLARGIFPCFGYSVTTNSTVYRFAWVGFLVVRILCSFTRRLCKVFVKLHDSIRDERYLIGRGLQNYGGTF